MSTRMDMTMGSRMVTLVKGALDEEYSDGSDGDEEEEVCCGAMRKIMEEVFQVVTLYTASVMPVRGEKQGKWIGSVKLFQNLLAWTRQLRFNLKVTSRFSLFRSDSLVIWAFRS